MASRWPSATKDLRLRITWRFAFVPMGTVADPSPDAVYLDVGGKYCHGVVDHHQGNEGACSATRQLVKRPDLVYDHLVGPWHAALRMRAAQDSNRVQSIPWSPTIILHSNPDFDAMASAHLAMCIVEDGGLPSYANALADYADRVDQGYERLESDAGSARLYPLILMLSNLKDAEDKTCLARCLSMLEIAGTPPHEDVLRIGLELIKDWAHQDNPSREKPVVFHDGAVASELLKALQSDRQRFRALVSNKKIETLGVVRVPCGSANKTESIEGSAIPEYELCACQKLYLRANGVTGVATPLTVIRGWMPPSSTQPPAMRWIIAVDPTVGAIDAKVHLRGLGASLERAEQRARHAGDSRRQGLARFAEFPGVSDPWYDGRGHDWTIVDSPMCGSLLPYEKVCEILRSPFWEPEIESATIACGCADGELRRDVYVSNGRTRLDTLRAVLERLRNGTANEVESLLVVQAEVATEWGEEQIREFARAVVGGDAREFQFKVGVVYYGARGVFVRLKPGEAARRDVLSVFGRLVKLLANLAKIDHELVEGERSTGFQRGLRTEHVRSVAEYYSDRGELKSLEMFELAAALDKASGIDARIRGVGDLLEHLDDNSERVQSAQLNGLLFIVGCFGIIQALVAVFEVFDSPSNSVGVSPRDVWSTVMFAVSLLAVLFAGLMLSSSGRKVVQRCVCKVPRLQDLLFGDEPDTGGSPPKKTH